LQLRVNLAVSLVLIRGYFRDGVAATNFHELLRISTNLIPLQ
jgi:hypothetical protein